MAALSFSEVRAFPAYTLAQVSDIMAGLATDRYGYDIKRLSLADQAKKLNTTTEVLELIFQSLVPSALHISAGTRQARWFTGVTFSDNNYPKSKFLLIVSRAIIRDGKLIAGNNMAFSPVTEDDKREVVAKTIPSVEQAEAEGDVYICRSTQDMARAYAPQILEALNATRAGLWECELALEHSPLSRAMSRGGVFQEPLAVYKRHATQACLPENMLGDGCVYSRSKWRAVQGIYDRSEFLGNLEQLLQEYSIAPAPGKGKKPASAIQAVVAAGPEHPLHPLVTAAVHPGSVITKAEGLTIAAFLETPVMLSEGPQGLKAMLTSAFSGSRFSDSVFRFSRR